MNEKAWQNAMVIFAKATSGLRPSDAFTYTQVQSRFLAWCESGRGVLKINNVPVKMFPGRIIFTTWNHTISWFADGKEPFLTGTIHIIPDMPREDPPRYSPFHAATPEVPEFYQRKDEFLPEFTDTTFFDVPLDHPLLNLGRYVIDRFEAECPEFMLRSFPRMLLYELYALRAGNLIHYPEDLQRILNCVDHYLEDERLDSDLLCMVGHISRATLFRLFKEHLQMTPGEYIARRRMERASVLLRTSGMSISEIARRMQYRDPFYFSRCFRKYSGMSPRQWRNAQSELPVLRPLRESFSQRDIPGHKHWVYQNDRSDQ
jgi:AraC-like DNA-binding protein